MSYTQDESGQWWYTNPNRGNRQRVSPQTCVQCGSEFISHHPQARCSKACVGIANRGNRRGPRPCQWCGKEFTPPARENRRKTCSRRCAYDLGNTKRGRSGEANAKWKGGISAHSRGYVRQYIPGRGHLLQHRIVMEQMLGRPLVKGENVHHKNGVRDDNRPENLELWAKHQPPGQRVPEQRHCETCTCTDREV